MRDLEGSLRNSVEALRGKGGESHFGGLVLDVLQCYIRILSALGTDSVEGLITAKTITQKLQTYLENTLQISLMEGVVNFGVRRALKGIVMSAGNVRELAACLPGVLLSDDKEKKGGGGYGPH